MASAIGDLIVRFGADTTRFNRGASGMQKTMGRLKGLAFGVAGAFGAIGSATMFAGIIRSGEMFNRKMRNSLAIMGDVSDAMKKDMRNAAFSVARSTRFSAAEAAESYYYLASAGLNAAQSIAALPQVASFAQAGNFDLATATSLAADAQSALGMKSKDPTKNLLNLTRVTDVLTKANTLANATTQQFSESLTTKAGAALKIVGKDIEEGVGVLAAWADQGVKGADAGTAMNIVMRDLQRKAIENKAAFKAAGVSVFDSAGEMRNMADIVSDLEKRMAGLSDEQKKNILIQMGFQERSVIFLQTLIGTSDKIRDYEKALRNAGGTTAEVSSKQLTGAQKAMARFSAISVEVGSKLSEAFIPALTNVLGTFGNLLKLIGPSISAIVKTGIVFGAAATAIWLVNKAIRAYITFTKGAAIATAILSALSGPKGWIQLAAGVAAATIAVIALNRTFDNVNKNANAAANAAENVPPPLEKIGMQSGPIHQTAGAVDALAESLNKLPIEASLAITRFSSFKTTIDNISDSLSRTIGPLHAFLRDIQRVGDLLGADDIQQYEKQITPFLTGLTKKRHAGALADIFGDMKSLKQLENMQTQLEELSRLPGDIGAQAKKASGDFEEFLKKAALVSGTAEELQNARGRNESMRIWLRLVQDAIFAADAYNQTMIASSKVGELLGPFKNLEEAQKAAARALGDIAEPNAALDEAIEKIETLFNLGLLGAGAEGLENKILLIAKAMDEFDSALGGPAAHIAEMQETVYALEHGLSSAERTLRKFAQTPGVDPKQIAQMEDLQKKIDKLTKRNALRDEGERLAKQMMTPVEQLQDRLQHYQELYAAGGIDENTYMRLLEKERKTLQPEKGKPPYQLAGAAMRGSQEAWSSISQNWARMQGAKRSDPGKDTAQNTKDMKKTLDVIEKKMQELQTIVTNAEDLGIPA